jgi:hypothetical protein
MPSANVRARVRPGRDHFQSAVCVPDGPSVMGLVAAKVANISAEGFSGSLLCQICMSRPPEALSLAASLTSVLLTESTCRDGDGPPRGESLTVPAKCVTRAEPPRIHQCQPAEVSGAAHRGDGVTWQVHEGAAKGVEQVPIARKMKAGWSGGNAFARPRAGFHQ